MSATLLAETAKTQLCQHRDGVVALALKGSRPTVSAEILDAIEEALAVAEKAHRAFVIHPLDSHFAFGAELDGFAEAASGDTTRLDRALATYQAVMLRVRHASVPVIAAVRGAAISGGCELLMHCHRVVAHRKSFIGLQEARLGVLPSGGGLKEFALDASRSDDIEGVIARHFITASLPRGGDPEIAKSLGYLRPDDITTETPDLLEAALEAARSVSRTFRPIEARNPAIKSAGRRVLDNLIEQQQEAREQGKITPHQCDVRRHIAEVMCGGNEAPSTLDETTYFALERKHFLILAQLPKTQERLRHLRETGEVLKN
jgi:3-hydroxyacyl-CoA dehydrogenase